MSEEKDRLAFTFTQPNHPKDIKNFYKVTQSEGKIKEIVRFHERVRKDRSFGFEG